MKIFKPSIPKAGHTTELLKIHICGPFNQAGDSVSLGEGGCKICTCNNL